MTARDRREAGGRPLKRRVGTRRPRKTLVIFCEGTRTEPDYLKALKLLPEVREVAAVDIRVETGRGRTDQQSLVSLAVAARDRAVDTDEEIDEFWCVFDVEWPGDHHCLQVAISEASTNNIEVAASNPCFELWLILHLREQTAWLDNNGARRLRSKLDGSDGKGLSPATYMPFMHVAAQRAATLDDRHQQNSTRFPDDNPSSGMHRLLATIQPSQ